VFSIVQHCSTASPGFFHAVKNIVIARNDAPQNVAWQLQCSSATATKSQWREQLLGINLWQRQIAVASQRQSEL